MVLDLRLKNNRPVAMTGLLLYGEFLFHAEIQIEYISGGSE